MKIIYMYFTTFVQNFQIFFIQINSGRDMIYPQSTINLNKILTFAQIKESNKSSKNSLLL